MMRGSDYGDLLAFVAVADALNFRRAATRLGFSPSALSHTIRTLEDRLGVKLLHRTTRSVAVTEAGAALLAGLGPAFAGIDLALEAVRAFRDRPSGTVRVTLPKIAARIALAPVLGHFASACPDIRLELVVDDDFVDVVAAGFDAGIRSGLHVEKDMVAVRVTAELRSVVVAAPAYLASHPAPITPDDLPQHACINYRWTASGALYRWPFSRDGASFDRAVDGPLMLDDVDLIAAAALDGVGLACVVEAFVADHLASGRLVRVLDDWSSPIAGFFLYYPGRRQMSVGLRALVDFLRLPAPARASSTGPATAGGVRPAARRSRSTPRP